MGRSEIANLVFPRGILVSFSATDDDGVLNRQWQIVVASSDLEHRQRVAEMLNRQCLDVRKHHRLDHPARCVRARDYRRMPAWLDFTAYGVAEPTSGLWSLSIITALSRVMPCGTR
jgi:hypothetical protein